MKTPQLKIDHLIEDALSSRRVHFEGLQKTGDIIVQILDHDAKGWEKLVEAGFPESELYWFERIGRKQLFWELLIHDGPAIKRLRRCPYSEQVKYLREPIPVLLENGEHLLVAPQAMDKHQAKQCIGDRVFSLGEQRARREGLKHRPVVIHCESPYSIQRGKIIFHGPCTMSVGELSRILTQAISK